VWKQDEDDTTHYIDGAFMESHGREVMECVHEGQMSLFTADTHFVL